MKKSAPSLKNQNPELEAALKAVYKDGFNIYAAINRLKKEMKRSTPFPDEVLIGVCDSYWNNKAGIKRQWPWFIQAMVTESNLWANREHEKNKPDPRAGMAQSIKDILKSL